MNQSYAQTYITGKSSDFENDSLKVYIEDSFVVNNPIYLGTIKVDSAGYFSLAVNVDSTIPVYIDLPNAEVYLKIEDSGKYDIRLPAKEDFELKRKLFPLSPKLEIPAYIVSESNDLNINLLRLQNVADELERKLIFVRDLRLRKKLYDSLVPLLDTIKATGNTEYFNTYKLYLLGKVHKDLFHYKYKYYLDSLIAGRQFYNNIPSFIDFFSSLYSDYFINGEINSATVYRCIANYDYKSLIQEIVKANDSLITANFANNIAMYGLYQEFYKTPELQDKIIQIFSNIQNSGYLDAQQQRTAKEIYRKFTNLRKGYKSPYFKLPNEKLKYFEPKNFKGDFVYLNFYSPYCKTCYSYMEVLKKYQEQKIKKLDIVTIFIGDSLSEMKEFLDKHKDYKWTFLFVDYKSDVIKKYNIRAFPEFYLINPEWKIAVDNCPSPLENFENIYNQAYLEWMKQKKEKKSLH